MLGQLNFADFLRSPGGHEEHGRDGHVDFNFIPATPSDRRPDYAFETRDYLITPTTAGPGNHFSDIFPHHHDIGSPPPPLGGILAPPSPRYRESDQTSLHAPSSSHSLHSRSSSTSSLQLQNVRQHPYAKPDRRGSGGSFDSSIYSQSEHSVLDLSNRMHMSSSSATTNSAITTGCIDQSAMMSLCPGEMMGRPTAPSTMTTGGDTMTLQTPWTAHQLTADTSVEEDSDDEQDDDDKGDMDAEGETDEESSESSEDSGSVYAGNSSEDFAPANRSRAPAAKKTPIKKISKAKAKPVLQRKDHPIMVTALTASGKKSHARKRPIDHIPRPRNAFILFRKHVVDAKLIPAEVEIRHQNISVVVSKMWAEADVETKTRFQDQARAEKEEHMKNYPDYKYQPVYRRSNVSKRKAKADPIEEKKCEVVANLLIEGKLGEELESGASKAVKAADRRRAVQAAKLSALRKTASQNSLRTKKANKGKAAALASQESPFASRKSSPSNPGYHSAETNRSKSTLFPLAEQLLQSSSIVISGQKAVEEAIHVNERSSRTSVSSIRDFMQDGMSGNNGSMPSSIPSSLGMGGPQTSMTPLVTPLTTHQYGQYTGYQQTPVCRQRRQNAMYTQDSTIVASQDHHKNIHNDYSNNNDHSMQVQPGLPSFGAISSQYLMENSQSSSSAAYAGQNISHSAGNTAEQPPSHYVLDLLSHNHATNNNNNNTSSHHGGNGMGLDTRGAINGQGMYELDMSGYSEALAQMSGYNNGQM